MSANVGQSVSLATEYTPFSQLSQSWQVPGEKLSKTSEVQESRGNRSATGRALTGSEVGFASIRQVPFIFTEAYVQANLEWSQQTSSDNTLVLKTSPLDFEVGILLDL